MTTASPIVDGGGGSLTGRGEAVGGCPSSCVVLGLVDSIKFADVVVVAGVGWTSVGTVVAVVAVTTTASVDDVVGLTTTGAVVVVVRVMICGVLVVVVVTDDGQLCASTVAGKMLAVAAAASIAIRGNRCTLRR